MNVYGTARRLRGGLRVCTVALVAGFVGLTTVPDARADQADGPRWTVKQITTLTEYGKSVDWSAHRDLILSARRGHDGYYDVFKMRPDGTGARCLTQGKPGCPQRHNGNAAWHPGGQLIVFTAENEQSPLSPDQERYAYPGSGLSHDLWLMDATGTEFYRLTAYALTLPLRAVIHPQFSNRGDQLAWAERVASGDSFGGGWVIKLADFVNASNTGEPPRLDNVQTLQPVERSCFYEVHDFADDDGRLLFSGNLQPDQPHVGLDIYELNLQTDELTRLTDSFEDWDEHAHYSPDGGAIAWMSSTGLDVVYGSTQGVDWADYLKTELWIMAADGSQKQQLTYFNTPGHPEHVPGARCIVSDSTWDPDGSGLVACVAWCCDGQWGVKLVKIELQDATQAPANAPDASVPCYFPGAGVGLGVLGAWGLARR